ncbi:calcium/sodium antiporter [Patescibacteria group bacterium]|nr:calcium/sodium antiporter [Patescibacteria group bacterium]MBU1890260.1 calcium/sodium antiporter [Patescibacteria group bacterium]
MLVYLLFIIGFVILLKGADWLVEGASSVAKRFGISGIVIGLTIVSFGTSAPELLVNVIASIQGNNELAIGNILGSNLSNIFLILGIAAIIYPLKLTSNTTWKEIPLSLLAVVVFSLMVNDRLVDGNDFSVLGRIDGFVLLAFFVIFIYYTFGIGKVQGEKQDHHKEYPSWKAVLMMLGGMIGLALGGKWVVDGAMAIAEKFGMSEAFIGLTIVAIGTSLPELATSVVAAMKKKVDIAVGNVVGSNIFNILWILGLSAVIKPLYFSVSLNFDIMMVTFSTFLLFLFMFVGKKRILERWQGISFVAIYVLYIAFLFFRG